MRTAMAVSVILAFTWVGTASATCSEQSSVAVESKAQSDLDLSTLEDRLRETPAIGFFTKLTLKNQITDLLDAVRAYHNGNSGKSLEQLREQYNFLLLKVESLIQDEEPGLSRQIYASRDAIWCLLADPEKFSKLQAGEKT